MTIKEDIQREISGKFPGVNLEVPLKLAIEKAYEAGLEKGEKKKDADKWKSISERATREAEFKRKELESKQAELDKIKQLVGDFITGIKKVSIIK